MEQFLNDNIHSLKKAEKLKSTKDIEALFGRGKLITNGNITLKYNIRKPSDGNSLKIGVTVSRKKFKKSVDRNFVKRILRECYRLKKNEFTSLLNEQFTGADFMFIYNNNTLPEFQKTMEDMVGLAKRLGKKVAKNEVSQ